MNKPLEKIFSIGKTIQMTQNEKNSLRLHLAEYMRRHPKGVSPYLFFRTSLVGALAILLFVGTGGIAAFASQKSTPGNLLYPVKRSIESVKKATLTTPEQKAAYQLALIEERFSEVTTMLANNTLTPENESIIAQDIKTHTEDLQNVATKLATNNPAEALSYTNQLAHTLKSSTETLLAFSDQKNPSTDSAPTRLVLASYETARKIDQETQELQEIVLSDTNIATVRTAEKKYQSLLAFAETKPELFTLPEPAQLPAGQPQAKTITMAVMSSEPATPTIPELFIEIKTAYQNKEYGKVIVLSETIDTLINEMNRSKEIKQPESTSGTISSLEVQPIIPIIESIPEKTTEVKNTL